MRLRGAVFQVPPPRWNFSYRQADAGGHRPAYAVPSSGVAWNPGKAAVLVLMVASGTVVFSSLFVVYASLCFFTTEGLEVMNILTDGGREFGQYPFFDLRKGCSNSPPMWCR